MSILDLFWATFRKLGAGAVPLIAGDGDVIAPAVLATMISCIS